MKKQIDLLSYLDSHLKFGCIDSVQYHITDRYLFVRLFPFRDFYSADKDFIRETVLESNELCEMKCIKLKHLTLGDNAILAVYTIIP